MQGLKQMRKERKLTLKDIARGIGCGQAAVSLWERGERFPRKPVLEKLCVFFNCKVDDLL